MFSFAKQGQQVSEAEQRQIALDVLLEAWNTAIDRGVDTEVLAKTAIEATHSGASTTSYSPGLRS